MSTWSSPAAVFCLLLCSSTHHLVVYGSTWRRTGFSASSSSTLGLSYRSAATLSPPWKASSERGRLSGSNVWLGGSLSPLRGGGSDESSMSSSSSSSTTLDDPTSVDSTTDSSASVARGGSTTATKKRKTYYPPNSSSFSSTLEQSALTTPQPSTTTSTSSPIITASVCSSSGSNTTDISLSTRATASIDKKKNNKKHKAIAKKLKNRNHTNLRRKIMHASFGLFFSALNHVVPRSKFVPGMTILTSATLLMELLRYRKGFGWMNEILHFVLGSSLRKHEMDGKFTGSFYYFLGVTLTAALYPKSSATLGILQLAIADPTASYFGRQTRHVYWSRIENGLFGFGRNKGILGFLGGAACCVPFNYRLLSLAKFNGGLIPGGTQSLWLASIALGMAGALADLAVPTPALTLPKRVCGVRVPPFHVDDNVVVPVVSGYACTKVFEILSWSHDLKLAPWMWL